MGLPKGFRHTEESKKKISEKLLGVRKPIGFGIGRIFSEETRKKIGLKNSIKLKGRKNEIFSQICKKQIGDKNPAWNGGSSYLPYSLDWTKTLRISIRERDKYTCQLCGEKQGDRAHDVHHIDYNKQNCSSENLITLCQKCHKKTNSNRDYWFKYFKDFITYVRQCERGVSY